MHSNLVCGIGINDVDYVVRLANHSVDSTGKRSQKMVWECPYYSRWSAMIRRCYSSAYQKSYPTYIGCTVCDDWLIFSNFKAWMTNQDWQGKELDKDIFFEGNKIYSPETCVFVDPHVNSFILDRGASRGNLPVGVSFKKDMGKYQSTCSNCITKKREHLGYFSDPEEAHKAWKNRKRELAFKLADMQADERVSAALRCRY